MFASARISITGVGVGVGFGFDLCRRLVWVAPVDASPISAITEIISKVVIVVE